MTMNPPDKINFFKRVLLIENDDVELYIAKRVILSKPFAEKVIIHSSPKDAIEHLKMQSANQLPDVIFLDVKLVEFDSFNFLEEYSRFDEKVKSRCKIVLLTNIIPKEYNVKTKKLHKSLIHSVMHKPLTVESLRKFILELGLEN